MGRWGAWGQQGIAGRRTRGSERLVVGVGVATVARPAPRQAAASGRGMPRTAQEAASSRRCVLRSRAVLSSQA